MAPKAKQQKTGGKKQKKDKMWKCVDCDFQHPAWHPDCSHCGRSKADILNLQAQAAAKLKNADKDGKKNDATAPSPPKSSTKSAVPAADSVPGSSSGTSKVQPAAAPAVAPAPSTSSKGDDESDEMKQLKKTRAGTKLFSRPLRRSS